MNLTDLLFTKAYAQGIVNTATSAAQTGKNVAVGGAESGIQTLISFVVRNIDNWIASIVIVVAFYILGKMGAAAAKKAILKKGEDIQESALILVERITYVTILTIGITIAFAINGLNFTAIIGALSLGIGFALKDIIGNFISGVIMLSQNRINIGDFIKVNEILGTIVSIDTRATILQAVDGTEVVIPNQTMLSEVLISYTTNPFRRIDLSVGVDYGTDLTMVTSLLKGILDKDEEIVVKPEPLILVEDFGDSSININIRFWVESSQNWQKVRSNLANRIKMAFDEVGVSIPFPIRTLKLDQDDRSFLKTMDSMKKGIVPEPDKVPDKAMIAEAATKTGSAVNIPIPIFEEHEKEGQVVTRAEMTPVAAHPDVAHKINPAPGHIHADEPTEPVAKEASVQPAEAVNKPETLSKPVPQTEISSANEPTITPPPTHL